MQKIIIFLILIISFGAVTSAQGLQYEMVSYTANNRDASTPFFNVSFLNKPFYTIDYNNNRVTVQFIFDFIIGISIALAVVLFTIGAFEGIINRQSNISQGIYKSKERMQNAVIGLMIIFSTWLIINTINPDLVHLPIFQGIDQLNQNTQGGTLRPPLNAQSTDPDSRR